MYLFINVDMNDGDYIGELHKITKEQLDFIQPVIDAIVENNGDFRDIRDMAYLEEIYDGEYDGIYSHLDPLVLGEFIETYVPIDGPSGEWCHTIYEISVVEKTEVLFEGKW